MDDLRAILHRVADVVADHHERIGDRPVRAELGRAATRELLAQPLPEGPCPTAEVVEELIARAAPGLTATVGPRYFGFVTGGALPAPLAADLLASGWDQNAFNEAMSPAALAFEDVAGAWLKDVLGLPAGASTGFVTGGQAANTVGLAVGRWQALRDAGWDVGADGLHGAPAVRVVVGAERHATIDRAVRLLGLGERSLVSIPATSQGAMDAGLLSEALERLGPGPTIVCAQAGNVNTGACDDLVAIADATRAVGGRLHVDGAFGLWAAASPRTRHLVHGIERADSWACDAHKWLNVPYDSGLAFCAHPEAHATAMSYSAAYLTGQVAGRDLGGGDFVPESSRRARGLAVWAALRALGRSGVADLVDHCCAMARLLADGLGEVPGVEVVNDVVLNQVLVRVGDEGLTGEVERRVQADGTCWLGGTTWRGERLLRVSVSNWSTSPADVAATVEAVARARREALARPSSDG